jgi:two-component sensor histidine kinase
LVSIVPAFTLGLLLTNNIHGLIYSKVAINYLDEHLPLLIDYGGGYTVFVLYSYALILGSCLYAISTVKHKLTRPKLTIYSLATIVSLPVLSNMYFMFISKTMYIDYTPTIFGLASLGLIIFAPSDLRVGDILPLEYANILGKMDDVVILTDLKNQIIHLNPAAKIVFNESFDIAEDNIVGRNLDGFLNGLPVNNPGREHSEIEINGKNYDVSVFTIPDWRGNPTTTCRILREVTERVSLDRKLRLLHLYASRISMAKNFEDVGEITANALKKSLGFSDGLLIITEEDKPVLKQVWGPIKDIAHSDSMMELLSKLGSKSYSRFQEFFDEIHSERLCDCADKAMMSTPIIDDGKQCGVICIFRDAEGSFSENERMLLEIFGNHIASAIHGIHHDMALKEAQKAEIANILEGASRVAGMVRHDLRGPLQTIRNASYIIEQDSTNDTKMTSIINKSVDYMNKIIEDLAYTDNVGRYNKLQLNMNTLIQQTLVQLLIPKNIEIKKDLYPGPLESSFDKIKIQRMLNNLLRNSIEAMPDGGILTITTMSKDSEIIVSIEDTGVGIKEVDKLFTPFISSKINGMGLGLVSVKQTAEDHNGTITVESEPGVGTKVTLRFPVEQDYIGNNATRLSSITAT